MTADDLKFSGYDASLLLELGRGLQMVERAIKDIPYSKCPHLSVDEAKRAVNRIRSTLGLLGQSIEETRAK